MNEQEDVKECWSCVVAVVALGLTGMALTGLVLSVLAFMVFG